MGLILILTSCGKDKESVYESKEITLSHPSVEESLEDKKTDSLQIEGIYPVKKDTLMYTDKDEATAYDKLEENSYVEILMEAEDGFVFVDFHGNQGYIKTDNIKKN